MTHTHPPLSSSRRILDTLIDAVDHFAQLTAPAEMKIGMNIEWLFDYFEFQTRTDA